MSQPLSDQGDVLRAAMFLVYGDPKVCGKTTMLVRAFPRACFIGQRSAIQLVARSNCGFQPNWIVDTITTLPELLVFLQWYSSAEGRSYRKSLGTDEIVVDDLSQICLKSMILWRENAGRDKFSAYQLLDTHLDRVSYMLRETGALAALSMHKIAPVIGADGSVVSPGAPEVPSKNQVQSVPGWADFVAPVETCSNSLDRWWPRVLRVDRSPGAIWVSGDRNNVAWRDTPANLREILLASQGGYSLPRLPGLEWQDALAQTVCDQLSQVKASDADAVVPVLEDVFGRLGQKVQPGTPEEVQFMWACQDGIARYTIKKRQRAGVLGQFREATVKSSNGLPSLPAPGGGSTPSAVK